MDNIRHRHVKVAPKSPPRAFYPSPTASASSSAGRS
jgi:hypothetical protein